MYLWIAIGAHLRLRHVCDCLLAIQPSSLQLYESYSWASHSENSTSPNPQFASLSLYMYPHTLRYTVRMTSWDTHEYAPSLDSLSITNTQESRCIFRCSQNSPIRPHHQSIEEMAPQKIWLLEVSTSTFSSPQNLFTLLNLRDLYQHANFSSLPQSLQRRLQTTRHHRLHHTRRLLSPMQAQEAPDSVLLVVWSYQDRGRNDDWEPGFPKIHSKTKRILSWATSATSLLVFENWAFVRELCYLFNNGANQLHLINNQLKHLTASRSTNFVITTVSRAVSNLSSRFLLTSQ